MANQAYIDSSLKQPFEKMIVATLNQMPQEPAQFMKDYISLHYFFEKPVRHDEQHALVSSCQADTSERRSVRVSELERLR